MRVVVAGGTGFLGSPLAEVYAEEGHDVRVFTRSLPPGTTRHEPGTGVPGVTSVGWRPDGHAGELTTVVDGADAVINLAGASLAAKRWTPARKAELRDSRLLPTRSLASAIVAAPRPPQVFVSASGVGYYGPAGAEQKTEDAPPGTDFLAQMAVDWEAEARKAESATRVVLVRSGVVLERSGGALAKLIPPFKMFAGGPLGSGRQYFPWIHRIDWIELVRWIVETPAVRGPINATAPETITNRQFARALGRALRRPAIIPTPGFALKLMLGEMATPMLLQGQRAVPAKALAHGFHFRYPSIEQAFRGILGE